MYHSNPTRHVILPKPFLKLLPKNYFEPDDSGVLRILSETEWRGIGITQSLGWEHYEVHGQSRFQSHTVCLLTNNNMIAPEPHVLLFRRAKAPAPAPTRAAAPAAKAGAKRK